jgi:predicted secreted hydrolase
MRRLVASVAAVASLFAASAVAAGVQGVQLPQDHYGHPGSQLEWWYFSALVNDPSGTHYSVFFTLFSGLGFVFAPVAQVVNLDTGAIVGHSEALALGTPGTSALDVDAAGSRLDYQPATDTWDFAVSSGGLDVSLSQQPEKPYALHGDGTGVIRQSVAGISHYYSGTRMRATGTLGVGGTTVALTGESWFDHQWGDYAFDPRAFNWDWFSCRFDDHTELMGYQFLDRRTGRPLSRFATGTFVSAEGQTTAIDDFQATHDDQALVAADHTWPLHWQLHASSPRLSEAVTALFPDQLVRNAILPTFWEGVATATGTHQGPCFVEISYR